MKIRIREGTFYARMAARKMKSHSLAIVWRNSVHLHNISREQFLRNKPFVLHELAHVQQFQRYGTFLFVSLYLWESVRKGYYNNRFEIEARKAEQGSLNLARIELFESIANLKLFHMRKIVAGFAASIDGYIEGPNGEYDWILIDEKIDFAEEMKRFDAFFFGRRSYEALGKNTGKQKGITNYVFSNTLQEVNKNFVLVKGDIKQQVESIKQQEGKDIAVWGGATLLASLLDLKLVDELSISFIPVLLGKGKPMVDVLKEKVWLQFLNSRRYENGTIIVQYVIKYGKK